MTAHQSLSNYSTLANTVKSLSISGKTITVTPGSGSAYTLTTQDTTYTHPTSSGNKHIPSGGSSGQFLGWSADGTAKWVNNPNTNTWTAMVGATSSANGSVGYVNATPPKDGYNTKYLRADGTWQVPPDHTYTVNNATLTIQKNSSNVATFTANASSNVTANITVPTKVSELTNDSGFITTNGAAYPRRVGGVTMNFNWSGQGGQPTWLWGGEDGTNMYVYNPANFSVNYANSAGSVAWGNVSGRPWALSQFTNDSGFLTTNWYNNVGAAGDGILQIGSSGGWYCQLRYDGLFLGNTGSFKPTDNQANLGDGSHRWATVFAITGSINTSDERQKDNIKQIDDKLLNAWENVNIVQFNFKDALEKKGANARLHTGYIAQNIQQACEENGVNPNDYGLFCFDSWEEQEEEKDENGRVIEPYRPKGDLYSLRYEEALIVECAYLRREVKRLSERLEKLEK